MPFSIKIEPENLQLTLSEEMTIATARELADALRTALQSNHTLSVDASQLTRIDASIIQILLASAQTAADTFLSAPSPAWASAFARYASPDPFRTT